MQTPQKIQALLTLPGAAPLHLRVSFPARWNNQDLPWTGEGQVPELCRGLASAVPSSSVPSSPSLGLFLPCSPGRVRGAPLTPARFPSGMFLPSKTSVCSQQTDHCRGECRNKCQGQQLTDILFTYLLEIQSCLGEQTTSDFNSNK